MAGIHRQIKMCSFQSVARGASNLLDDNAAVCHVNANHEQRHSL